MDSPRRIVRMRLRGWTKGVNTVCVDRSSRWGNPFKMVPYGNSYGVLEFADLGERNGTIFNVFTKLFDTSKEARSYAVELFEREVCCKPEFIEKVITQLKGKNLACYCPINEPCHADVLLRIANGATSNSPTSETPTTNPNV